MDNEKRSAIYGFGAKLQELRKNRNLSQKEVAARLNLHPNTISHYENETLTPSLEVMVDLAILYNSSIDYILGITNRKNVYLDDCTPDQQEMILEIIDIIKKKPKNTGK